MRWYDGSSRWAVIEATLRNDGYALRFSCASFDCPPDDLIYTGNESGWEMRRLITDWCTRNAVTEYRILRNTSYHRDLHGPRVYELWTKTNQKQKRKRI